MLKRLRQLYSPRIFESDEDKPVAAKIFSAISSNIMVFLLVLGLGTIFLFEKKLAVAISGLVLLSVVLISRGLANRGNLRLSGTLLVSGMWTVFTVLIWFSGGVNTVITGSYVIVTVMAGSLLGERAAITTAILSAFTGFAMIVLEGIGYPPPHYFPLPPTSALVALIFWLILALPVINLALHAFSEALNRARQEIKEREIAQRGLRESKDRYERIARAVPGVLYDYVIAADGSSSFRYISPRCIEIFELEAEALRHDENLLWNMVHPDDLARWRDNHVAASGSPTPFLVEIRIITPSGLLKWIHITSGPSVSDLEGPTVWSGFILDITERMAAEEALRESEDRSRFLSSVLDLSSQPFAMGYVHGDLGIFNTAYCNLVGYSQEEVRFLNWKEELTAPEYHELETRKLAELVLTGEPVRYEKEYIRKDGRRVPVELLVHAVTDEAGKPLYYYSFITDLTDRKQAEDALRESEARVRMKLDAILSPEGDIGTLELADVINTQEIQALMDDFFSLTNIGMAIIDLEGRILVATGWQEICTKFHRPHPEAGRFCVESDTKLSGGVEPGTFKLYRCKNNLWDMATPIIVGGKHLGNLFLGQFLFTDESPDYEAFRSQARVFGFDEKEYLEALDRVPRWSRETIDTVMTFYTKLANILSTLSYSNIRLARTLAEQEILVDSLRESEERYRSLFDNMLEGFAYCKMIFEDGKPQDFVYLSVNNAFYRLTGLDNVIGKKVTEVIPGIFESDPGLFDICGRVALSGTPEKFDAYVDAMGIWFSISVYSTEREYFVAVFDNVTEKKQAEEALAASEQKYRAVFNNASVGIDLVDRDGRFLEVNETLSSFLGYTQDELKGLRIFDITHPEDVDKSVKSYSEFIMGETDRYRFEKRYVRKDGAIVWADVSVSAYRDRYETYVLTVGVIVDITQRKKAEQIRLFLTAAVEQAAETITITETDGTIVYVNPAFEKTTGYSRQEALGNNPRILKSGVHGDDFYKDMWETITAGRVWTGHLMNRKKDGSLFEEEASISPIKDDSGKIVRYVAVKRDVTKEVSLQKQLLHAQKMEAIGTLAGGIAHDFNNLLQITLGYSELLISEKREDDSECADLRKIHQAATSGAELVKGLLTFSRKVEPKLVPMDLNSRIRQVEQFLRRTIPRMIDIRFELTEDLQRVNADPIQIDQILMNLTVNARDAINETGSIVIETRNVTLDEDDVRPYPDIRPGDYVFLSISDTGHGMDRETIDHIFEPFYTTKELGRGTGLGLATVYGVIKQHGGLITCYSEVGRGTIFKVYLPAISREFQIWTDSTADEPISGTETILLVDDEDVVRELGERILTKGGYKVLTATNGEQALIIYGRLNKSISLVILDLIMPAMGGGECLTGILNINPNARVIIASGFSPDAETFEQIKLAAKGFVEKPFRSRHLLTAVRKAIDTI